MTKFSELVSDWARQSDARITATYRRSVELLADEMMLTKPYGGRVPVDTGNLARSVVASTKGMPKISKSPAAGVDIGLITAKLLPTQTVFIGWTAAYAKRMNYGYIGSDSKGRVYNQSGNYFVEYAIEMWPTIVQLASEELQAKVEARKNGR